MVSTISIHFSIPSTSISVQYHEFDVESLVLIVVRIRCQYTTMYGQPYPTLTYGFSP